MLTEEQIREALRPLCKDAVALEMMIEVGMEEYRAIEQAVRKEMEGDAKDSAYLQRAYDVFGRVHFPDEGQPEMWINATRFWDLLGGEYGSENWPDEMLMSPADEAPEEPQNLQTAYQSGWEAAASWVGRSDLLAVVGSPHYLAEMAKDLASLDAAKEQT